MKLIKILDKVNNDFKGVYECETCHGIRIDNGFYSYDDENFHENVIPNMTCPLCDKKADLSERYMMALDTLAWATGKTGHHMSGEDYGFPSIDDIFVAEDDIGFIATHIQIDGIRCEPNSYSIGTDENTPRDFNVQSALGELSRKLTARGIAKELVSRVVKDLAARNKKTEEKGRP